MLSGDEKDIVDVVRDFVDKQVRPQAHDLKAGDAYPDELIEEMKKLGCFGLLVPAEYGGTDVSTECFARVTEELARGWMGLAALDDAVSYAQVPVSFGKPISKHQAIGHHLADMATKISAARLMIVHAVQQLDAGDRADMEAGMAKVFASEAAMEVDLDAMRVHRGYGFSKEYDVERYFRDVPLMILGDGTNEYNAM